MPRAKSTTATTPVSTPADDISTPVPTTAPAKKKPSGTSTRKKKTETAPSTEPQVQENDENTTPAITVATETETVATITTTTTPISSSLPEKNAKKTASRAKKTASVSTPASAPETTNNTTINTTKADANACAVDQQQPTDVATTVETTDTVRKRGRKPKGSKVVSADLANLSAVEFCPNVVLYLQCSIQDMLKRNRELTDPIYSSSLHSCGAETGGTLITFQGQHSWFSELPVSAETRMNMNNNEDASNTVTGADMTELKYDPNLPMKSNNVLSFPPTQFAIPASVDIHGNALPLQLLNTATATATAHSAVGGKPNMSASASEMEDGIGMDTKTTRVQIKIKQLESKLKLTSVCNKKSACFWDTCHFTNSPVYLPLHIINGTYHVYGNFCSPECAAAYLMNNDKLDSSTKFERFALLNQMYSSIYEYERPIKLALNPHYTLDKFMGNLSIQEYRALNQCDRNYLLVDKPLSHTLPEIIANGDDHVLNNKFIPTANTTKTPADRMKQKSASAI